MDPVLDLTLRTALGLLFAVAAFHKLQDRQHFAATVAEYRLLPATFADAGAGVVILAELGVVAALALRPSPGIAAGAGLLAGFRVRVGVSLARGPRPI